MKRIVNAAGDQIATAADDDVLVDGHHRIGVCFEQRIPMFFKEDDRLIPITGFSTVASDPHGPRHGRQVARLTRGQP